MLGNPPRILPVIDLDFSLLPSGYAHLDSLEVKWVYEDQVEENHLRCPAELTDSLQEFVEDTALRAWSALGIRDWCRIAMRCDIDGRPYVLDVNSPAGLIPPAVSTTSFSPSPPGLPALTTAGLSPASGTPRAIDTGSTPQACLRPRGP